MFKWQRGVWRPLKLDCRAGVCVRMCVRVSECVCACEWVKVCVIVAHLSFPNSGCLFASRLYLWLENRSGGALGSVKVIMKPLSLTERERERESPASSSTQLIYRLWILSHLPSAVSLFQEMKNPLSSPEDNVELHNCISVMIVYERVFLFSWEMVLTTAVTILKFEWRLTVL